MFSRHMSLPMREKTNVSYVTNVVYINKNAAKVLIFYESTSDAKHQNYTLCLQ